MEQKRIQRVLQAMKERGLSQMIVCDPESVDYLTGVYVAPFERLFALYLQADGGHVFFLNKLFTVPETPHREGVGSPTPTTPLAWWPSGCGAGEPLGHRQGVDRPVPAPPDGAAARHPLRACQRLRGRRPGQKGRAGAGADAPELPNQRPGHGAGRRLHPGGDDRAAGGGLPDGPVQRPGLRGPVPFPPLCPSGPTPPIPHHMPDDTVLRAGGLHRAGHRREEGGGTARTWTRTYFCKTASEQHRAIHDLVRKANEAAEALVRPGCPCATWTRPPGT